MVCGVSGYLHRVYIIHPNCSFTFLRCLLSAQSRRLDGEDGTASALGRAAGFQVRVRDDLSVQHLGPGQLRRGGLGRYSLTLKTPPAAAQSQDGAARGAPSHPFPPPLCCYSHARGDARGLCPQKLMVL